jgi:hypothetical protein
VPEITITPTCAEDGERTYNCSLCGDSYTEVMPYTGNHEYESETTKEPACDKEGETTYTCTVCGDTYTEPIDAIGHDYQPMVVEPATCTEEGIMAYTCNNCGNKYEDAVPATGHTESDWVVSARATTFKNGEQVKVCTVCQEVLQTETIPSALPSWSLYVIIAVVVAVIGATFIVWKKKKKNI